MSKINIEDNPKLRSPARRIVEWGFTTFMWALWLYLFLPLVTVVLWVAGAHYVYLAFFERSALDHLVEMITKMGWAVVVIFLVMRGWGYYNYYVFGRKNRRKMHNLAGTADLGKHIGLTGQEVWRLQNQKEIVWEPLYDEMRAELRSIRPPHEETEQNKAA